MQAIGKRKAGLRFVCSGLFCLESSRNRNLNVLINGCEITVPLSTALESNQLTHSVKRVSEAMETFRTAL